MKNITKIYKLGGEKISRKQALFHNLKVGIRRIIKFDEVSFFYDGDSITTKSLFLFRREFLRIPPVIWNTLEMMFKRTNHKKIQEYTDIILKTKIYKKGYSWQKDAEWDHDAALRVSEAKTALVKEYLNLK